MSLEKQQPLVSKTKSNASLLPYKPCGKGKTKIAMKYREDKRQRQITASKRLPGLMKKAAQYSELTGAKVVVLVRDEQRRVYRYCSEGEVNIEKSANRMLTDPAEKVFTTEQFSECSNSPNENSEKHQMLKLSTNNNSNSQEYKKKNEETKNDTEESIKFQSNTNETSKLEENNVNVPETIYHVNDNFPQWSVSSIKSPTFSDVSPQLYEMKMTESALFFPYNIQDTTNYTNICDTSKNFINNYYSNASDLNFSNFKNQENNYINSEMLWYPEKLKMFSC